MRITVLHKTTFRYDTPAGRVIQILRLTPRSHDGQYVARWRIDVSSDCRLDQHEDAFGNITHSFTTDGPISELVLSVHGEAETRDTGGVVHGVVERFPPGLFLRETPLTSPDAAIIAFADRVRSEAGGGTLDLLHHLLACVHHDMTFDTASTQTTTTAVEAFQQRRGVCQDLSHVFIAAARSLGIPARYIGGYFRRNDGMIEQNSGHAWAEAHVPDLGWVGFDPANGICTTDAHIRIAAGLDYLGAAPVRGTRYGGGSETMAVDIRVAEQAASQTQS
jgi:transglutaminase-like putative cysteine protease